ncbi:MAG TPA: flagellar basal body-associated FliL family protein [Spirochaetota bacterium]|nr:flagellar basal body-associated FliL family protein [Spirochaetota bacterium]
MAENENAEEQQQPEEQEEQQDQEGQASQTAGGSRFRLDSRTINILKMALQYFIVAIIAFLVSYLVVSGSEDERKDDSIKKENADLGAMRKAGYDWPLTDEAMMITTADEQRHIMKVKIVLKIEEENPQLENRLTQMKSDILDQIYQIVGSKKVTELDSVQERKYLRKEIAERVQQLINMPGLYRVLFTEVSIH